MLWQIELGIYQTAARYEDTIRKSDPHISITKNAEVLLRSPDFICEPKRQIVTLTDVSIRELGFGGGAQYERILEYAENKRLRACPLEIGPAFRLAYRAQVNDQGLVIASKASGGRLFQIYRDSLSLTLGSISLPRDQFLWDSGTRLMFIQY